MLQYTAVVRQLKRYWYMSMYPSIVASLYCSSRESLTGLTQQHRSFAFAAAESNGIGDTW